MLPRGPLRGRISVPADKSISHRAVIFASLADGRSRIRNMLRAEDPLRTVDAFRAMGISIENRGDEVLVDGKGLRGLREPGDVIYCGNSGTTTRLLLGILGSLPFFSCVTGDRSLRSRPMGRVVEPLRLAGARIDGRDDGSRLPLAVRGEALKTIDFESPRASAQVKTCLLLAGLFREGRSTVREPERSRDHTERMLPAFGVHVGVDGTAVSVRGPAELKPVDVTVPGDFSSAAFFIVAALVVPGSELVIENVGLNPTRTGLLDALRDMGAAIEIQGERLASGEPVGDILVRHSALRGIEVDGPLVPRMIDEFPVFSVAAALAEGKTVIRSAGELRVKESDRIGVMAKHLRQCGVAVEEWDDGMEIAGAESLAGGVFESHGDHRVSMAMAVAGLRSRSKTRLTDVDCVATSFPGFWELLDKARGGPT